MYLPLMVLVLLPSFLSKFIEDLSYATFLAQEVDEYSLLTAHRSSHSGRELILIQPLNSRQAL